MSEAVRVERVYDLTGSAPSATGPVPMLVDRLWPRGVSRADLDGVGWMREIAPSKDLRRWYGHEIARWPEFRERYRAELREAQHEADLSQLRALATSRGLILITATRDVEHSGAQVLAELLNE